MSFGVISHVQMLRHQRLLFARVCRSQRHRCAFHTLGVASPLAERLQVLGLTTPTPAQQKAIPLIRNGNDVVIAAETGGGKTLAYVVPVLERLHTIAPSNRHAPVALIMTTSQELVMQIAHVIQQLDSIVSTQMVCLSSKAQVIPTNRPCPLLIATPKALLRATKPKDFAFTQLIVIDEADMLLGGGFERDTKQIIATIRNQPLKKAHLNTCGSDQEEIVPEDDMESSQERQTIFSAATIPDYGKKSVQSYINYKFPNAVVAKTLHFHRPVPQLQTEMVELPDQDDPEPARMQLCVKLLQETITKDPNAKILVFTNSVASADRLYAFLHHEKAFDCRQFHKEIERSERQRVLEALQTTDSDAERPLVVVCTDMAARGLDTTHVGHVLQYEFANDVVTFLHRIGRTARGTQTPGRVISIVYPPTDTLVVSKIQEAMQTNSSLANGFSRKRSLRKKVKKLYKK